MKPLLERAFEIARSGSCPTQTEIARQLTKEGYEGSHQHLSGAAIRKELNALCRSARGIPDRQHGPSKGLRDNADQDHQ